MSKEGKTGSEEREGARAMRWSMQGDRRVCKPRIAGRDEGKEERVEGGGRGGRRERERRRRRVEGGGRGGRMGTPEKEHDRLKKGRRRRGKGKIAGGKKGGQERGVSRAPTRMYDENGLPVDLFDIGRHDKLMQPNGLPLGLGFVP